VPLDIIQQCIRVAGTAPSGAHCQPWTFVIVTDPAAKAAIRAAVEKEEQVNYDRRMRQSWVEDVQGLVGALHTGDKAERVVKPYLTEAPALVVVMKQAHGVDECGEKVPHYYVEQSVGLAVGMFLAALTNIGLFSLTSTPMGAEGAIRDACGRPQHEKVFLLMPVGWPAENASVPYRSEDTLRKPLEEVAVVV
jgi:iodotyrosine deiodinase